MPKPEINDADLEVVYPIAEIFHSIQGEGQYTGTATTFIRLAGCNVGKPYSLDAKRILGLSVYQDRCTAWDGVSFPCDTNYRVHQRLSVKDIVTAVAVAKRICITGGEPLIHDLCPLVRTLHCLDMAISLETSGTLPLSTADTLIGKMAAERPFQHVWLTVSPKQGYLKDMVRRANELKILVGNDFSLEKFQDEFLEYAHKIWVQPVNEEHSLNTDNLNKCIELVNRYRAIRLSVQLHKILHVR